MDIIIRDTELRDLNDTLDIYNYEVKNGVATFDLKEKTLEEWEGWYKAHRESPYFSLVAEVNGRAVGYGTLSGYRPKEAFITTAEISVYINNEYRAMGIGTALAKAVIARAKAEGRLHTIISVITAGNEISQKMHEGLGFICCGNEKEVAFKMGKFRDTVSYQLIL